MSPHHPHLKWAKELNQTYEELDKPENGQNAMQYSQFDSEAGKEHQ
jgi:hypothetical protein